MITIKKTPANLFIYFPFNDNYIKIIKCLPRRIYLGAKRCWKVPTMDLKKITDLLESYGVPYKVEEKEIENICLYALNQPKLKLYHEQEKCVQFGLNKKNVIYNMDIGFGKTATALITAITGKKFFGAKRCLIIVPASLKRQWCQEINKFTNELYNLIEGSPKKRIYESNAFFTIVSYETARNDINKIKKLYWDYLIIDEIVRIKNHKTKISRALKEINAKNKIALSGAILENRLEELYNILNFIRPDIFSSYWDFQSRFLVQVTRRFGAIQFRETVAFKNLDHLKDIMKDFVVKEKLTDLPGKVEKTIMVPMLPNQKRYHNEIADEVIEEIEINENPLAKLTALRQVCNHPGTVGLDGASNKIKELREILKEIGDKKVIIFTQFAKFANLIEEGLSNENKIFVTTGNLSSKEKDEIIKKWRKDGQILLTTDCMGYGINLQDAHILINMDLPWNPIKLQQRIGRIWRRGQKERCLIINILSEDSVEEKVMEYLNNKIALINRVMDEDVKRIEVDDIGATKEIMKMWKDKK